MVFVQEKNIRFQESEEAVDRATMGEIDAPEGGRPAVSSHEPPQAKEITLGNQDPPKGPFLHG